MEQVVNPERVAPVTCEELLYLLEALFKHQLQSTGGVYLVYYTNNESYDDYNECNIGITFSEEAAKEAVKKLSLVEELHSDLYPDEMSYDQRKDSRYDVMTKVLKELGASNSIDVIALLDNISGSFEYVKLPILK